MVKSKLFLLNMLSLCGATLFKKDSYPKASLIEDTALSLQPLRSTIQCAAYFMALLNKGNHPSLEYYIFEEVTNLCSLGTIDKLLAPPGAPPEQAVMELYKPPPCPSEDWFIGDTKCYMYLDELLNWQDAIDQCKALASPYSDHATLVSIHSAEEAQFIKSLPKPQSPNNFYYIGLNDGLNEGDFVWTDGTPLDFVEWEVHNGAPDNSGGVAENCVDMDQSNTWKFRDGVCSKLQIGICQITLP